LDPWIVIIVLGAATLLTLAVRPIRYIFKLYNDDETIVEKRDIISIKQDSNTLRFPMMVRRKENGPQ
jgi:hypothetical protein